MEYDTTESGEEVGKIGPANSDKSDADEKVDPKRAALVKSWLDKITRRYKNMEKTWQRMDKCMQIVKTGASDDWAETNYVAPVLARHINQSVAQLYARNPTIVAKRKSRMLFSVWDGKPESVKAAMEGLAMGDPASIALLEDIVKGQQYIMLMDKVGKTLQITCSYYLNEQEAGFKERLKAMVRRSKTNGVGYVKLGFQRILEENAERDASISDLTSKIARTQAGLDLMAKDDPKYGEDSAAVEQLRLNLKDLQAAPDEIVVREGPVFSFPKSKALVVDPECTHLKTFAGAGWVAEWLGDYTVEDVLAKFKVDLTGKDYTEFSPKNKDDTKGEKLTTAKCRIWELWDRTNRQRSVLCEGYCDFIKEPETPSTDVEVFYPYFPLILNEVESDNEEIPPSDVWMARHPQDEINRARQGLREHRISSRPYSVTRRGALTESDKTKLQSHSAFELVELDGLGPNEDVEKILKAGPTNTIDEKQYDVTPHFQDILRTVGAQEANLGPTSGDTATETSIAENSRMAANADHVDELDGLLTKLVRAMSQLLLMELSKETVLEIAGPGAAWPEALVTRKEIVKDLYLDIEAGSSGRPNEAAELAKLERASTTVLQLPGINPAPVAKKYLSLLDVDVEEAYVEGLPSIAAINQALSKQMTAAPPGALGDPAAQGPQGAANAPRPAQAAPQSQPAFPAPSAGAAPNDGRSAQNMAA